MGTKATEMKLGSSVSKSDQQASWPVFTESEPGFVITNMQQAGPMGSEERGPRKGHRKHQRPTEPFQQRVLKIVPYQVPHINLSEDSPYWVTHINLSGEPEVR